MINLLSHKKKAPDFKAICELIVLSNANLFSYFTCLLKFNPRMKPRLHRPLRLTKADPRFFFDGPLIAMVFMFFLALACDPCNVLAGDLRCLIGDDAGLKAECLNHGHWSASLNMPWIVAEKATISHFYSRGSFVLSRDVKKRAVVSELQTFDQMASLPDKKAQAVKTMVGKLSGECTGSVRLEVLAEHEQFDDVNIRLIPSGILPCNHLSLQFADAQDEVFGGAGEKFTYLFLDGQQIDTLSQEQGHGKGQQPITWIGNKL